jgi:hypothetical protein
MAMRRDRRRRLTFLLALMMVALIALTVRAGWLRDPDHRGIALIVAVSAGLVALGVVASSTRLSERRHGPWERARLQERYVWKVTEVWKDGESSPIVADSYLYLIEHAPRVGERVADPTSLGQAKFVRGPGILVPERVVLSGGGHQGYEGRTLVHVTSQDGVLHLLMTIPECALSVIDPPESPFDEGRSQH